MAQESEIKVINEEYERILENPDGMILSDSLVGMLPDTLFGDSPEVIADNHQLTITATDIDNNTFSTAAHGTLHSIMSGPDMSVGLTVRGDYGVLLQVLHDSNTPKMTLDKIQLVGTNGFTVSGPEISGWSLTKTKSYDFLLTINFRGSDVIF